MTPHTTTSVLVRWKVRVRFIMRLGEGTFVFICCRALCLQTGDNDIICSNPSSRPPRRRSMAFCLVFEFATENCATTAYVVSACVLSTAHLPTGLSSQVSLYSLKRVSEFLLHHLIQIHYKIGIRGVVCIGMLCCRDGISLSIW